MNDTYTPPSFRATEYNCPHDGCGVYARQLWIGAGSTIPIPEMAGKFFDEGIVLSGCWHCKQISLWVNQRLIWPSSSIAPMPNPDMPDDVKEDYMEAREVVRISPRAAAALLRLAVERYLPHLGENKAKSINQGIANLVKKGLHEKVQMSLDAVRVFGNHAVHPGQIDLKDDEGTALALFELLNIITTQMVTNPKTVDAAYLKIPEHLRQAIEKRDAKKP